MSNFCIGIDLGQVYDNSALAVVERLEQQMAMDLAGLTIADHHHVRYLKRWDLGTEYADVVKQTGDIIRRFHLEDAVLVIDATGVGRKVCDLYLQAYRMGELGNFWPRPYVITGGREVTDELVPKRELVGTMQTLIQSKRLKISEVLPEAELLKAELLNFKVKTSAVTGQDTYEAARAGDHDDIVLAVALACWYRHQLTEPRWIEGGAILEKVRYR